MLYSQTIINLWVQVKPRNTFVSNWMDYFIPSKCQNLLTGKFVFFLRFTKLKHTELKINVSFFSCSISAPEKNMTETKFSYNKVRLILDYLFSPVFPKVFESVKSDYFVLGAKIPKQLHIKFRNMIFTFLICGDLVHYCTTSFNKAWAQALRRFRPCSRRAGDLRWWGSLTVVPARNKAKRLSPVNHTTKTIHHHQPICLYIPSF